LQSESQQIEKEQKSILTKWRRIHHTCFLCYFLV